MTLLGVAIPAVLTLAAALVWAWLNRRNRVGDGQLTLEPSHSAYMRIDSVVLADEGIRVVTGVPSGSPVPPMLPPGATRLANLRVNTCATILSVADIQMVEGPHRDVSLEGGAP